MKLETNVKSGVSTSSETIQRFGRILSGMVMPNIGAFIAWSLITALFIPTGWTPNENLAKLVGPMTTYLLPLLIGYTGGKMVAGTRGGIIGMLLALLAYIAIGPVVLGLNNALKVGVEAIVNTGLLPIASVFIEPAKILFLNNVINHGVLGPLGVQQVAESGKSIFFLLEANPGPGLGILLAYWVFAKGMIKQSAPGSIIIHFLGGIHEIYFPYVLMNPILQRL